MRTFAAVVDGRPVAVLLVDALPLEMELRQRIHVDGRLVVKGRALVRRPGGRYPLDDVAGLRLRVEGLPTSLDYITRLHLLGSQA